MKNATSRILLLVTSILLSAAVLSSIARMLEGYLRLDYGYAAELAVVSGQVLFQWVFMWNYGVRDKMSYAVAVLSVSLLGSILLLPLVWYSSYNTVGPAAVLVYFFSVVSIMFVVHALLVKNNNWPWYLCGTWVLYRLLVLLLILES